MNSPRAREIVLAFPGDLETRTGGFIYDRRLAEELRACGHELQTLPLGDGFPLPSHSTLQSAEKSLCSLPAGTRTIVDGLAFGAMGSIAATICDHLRLTALVHHPLALETGLSRADADRLRESEITALGHASKVIVTSATTARELSCNFAVPPEKIVVARPGTEGKPLADGSGSSTASLLCVASVVPRKDLVTLVRALARISELPWSLKIVGSFERSAAATGALQRAIIDNGLSARVQLVGELDREAVDQCYINADIYVSSALYEGYGMALMDAVAFGLPIVAASGGAVADVVPQDAALLVRPSDVEAMAAALRRVILHSDLRDRLREGSRTARRNLPSWKETASIVSRALGP